jgi:hypothetical protein
MGTGRAGGFTAGFIKGMSFLGPVAGIMILAWGGLT